MAIAPTPARFSAADALAVPSRWVVLGADEQALWGRCRGSGREPYDTMVDHVHAAWRCSCPSRSQPCKHALALLVMWVKGQVPAATAPTGVRTWADGHARTDAAPAAPAATAPADDAADEQPRPEPPVDLDRQRDERVERLVAGLVELERWLDDRVRTGLADPALARYATWDELAARLVDARAGALANRVRRLAGVVGARPDWHEVVLAELGVLHLLARPAGGCRNCPAPLADAVATVVRLAGAPGRRAGRRAGDRPLGRRRPQRHPRGSHRGAPHVAPRGEHGSLGDDALVRRLPPVARHLARRSARRSPPTCTAIPGRRGVPSSASATTMRAAALPVAPPAGVGRRRVRRVGAALAAEPWLDRVPATVAAAPTLVDGRWVLTDATGAVAVAPEAPGVPTLLAASRGQPVDVTVEWTVDGAVPLTVHLPDRALDIGPRADLSFVSAA